MAETRPETGDTFNNGTQVEDYADNYIFDGMEYPSVAAVLEQQREIIAVETDAEHKSFAYASATPVEDMQLYINRLLLQHGFSLDYETVWTEGAFLVVCKIDADGLAYYLESMFNDDGYTITLWKQAP